MTILRRRRLLSLVRNGCRASIPGLTAACLACAAVLTGQPAHAVTHSHAHHSLPTPLHTTTVAETRTSARTGTKKRKGGAKAKSEVPSVARPRNTRESGHKAGHHGRDRHPEPVEDAIPMRRADRGAGRHEREMAQYGARQTHEHGHGFAAEPPSSLGAYIKSHERLAEPARAVAAGKRPAETNTAHTAPPSIPTQVASRVRPAPTRGESQHSDGSGGSRVDLPVAAPAAVYAQGVAHPEDDERMPRNESAVIETAEGEDMPTPVTKSVVITAKAPAQRLADTAAAPMVRANPRSGINPAAVPSPVVQGFGGEVAVPSSAAGARPGGTHRRNHPSIWAPEPPPAPPVALEEREAITEAAVSPVVLPDVYDRNGRLMMPAPLKGSREVLVHQNLMAASDGLQRIQDDGDLDRLRNAHLLVSFPVSASLRVSEDLPYNRRYARPWTVLFAADAGGAFFARFHQPLQVNSAVRTVSYQARLQYVNGNAAATSGEAASPHLTGQAIDVGKRGMSSAQLAWMRGYLLPLMRAGKIDVEEEFQQACFHISVYRSYGAGRRPVHEVAQLQSASVQSKAARGEGAQEEEVQ